MVYCQFIIGIVITLHLAVSIPVPFYKKLSPEDAARLAAWTPESKQNIWALSGQFEGDMILQPNQRNGLTNESMHWPNGVIPYEISSDFTEEEKAFIIQSLEQEFSKTCITVRQREEGETDYVHIIGSEPGCFAYVGHKGGGQVLNLQRDGCLWTGLIAHEFLHSAGFWHQQNVNERDDYVFVLWANIIEKEKHNFAKFEADQLTSYGEKYDYGSVMHYGIYEFSSNGRPTIIPKDLQASIGQRIGLSDTDIIKLNKMYKCN